MARNAVAKKGKTNVPATTTLFDEDSGAGMENVTTDDMAIPFLTILQSNSPQASKSNGAYIKGAEEGMIFNTVTKELVDSDDGIFVTPCGFIAKQVEWTPRDSGGGFIQAYEIDDPIKHRTTYNEETKKHVLPNGNILVETKYHYVLVEGKDGAQQGVISMTSSQLKKSRQWVSLMAALRYTKADGTLGQVPTFGGRYHLTTVPQSNNDGDWFNWDIKAEGIVDDEQLYVDGRHFHAAILDGIVKVQESRQGTADSEAESPSEGGDEVDDEIPF